MFAVRRTYVADGQTPRSDVVMAREVAQVPLVDSVWTVEPDRVIEAGTGEVLGTLPDSRMSNSDAVGGQVVGDVGQPAVGFDRGCSDGFENAHADGDTPDPVAVSPGDVRRAGEPPIERRTER